MADSRRGINWRWQKTNTLAEEAWPSVRLEEKRQ